MSSSVFNYREFRGITNFSHCKFLIAPQFHGATLHEDTYFDRTDFKDCHSAGARSAYRTLKYEMERIRARHDEATFFALEQRSIRKHTDTPMTVRIASLIYDFSCDYGRSLARPILLFGVATFVFAFTYLCIAQSVGSASHIITNVVGFTVAQIVRPFGVWAAKGAFEIGRIAGPESAAGLAVRLIATAQSIWSLALIAVFFLVLRRRFRMA